MHTIWYILLTILGLSILVITHELGHFLMGRWLGFSINEFSVGLGPKLFGIKGKRTEFTLRALPIGGSCRFYGEDGKDEEKKTHPEAFETDEPETKAEETPKDPNKTLFSAMPAWKRFLVVLAGPLVNILTCTVLCFVILLAYGRTTTGDLFVRVTAVGENSPAAEAGDEEGDILVSIDGKRFDDDRALRKLMNSADPNGMELVVLRGAEIETHTTEEKHVKQTDVALIGGSEVTLRFTRMNIDQKTGDKLMGVGIQWGTYSVKEETFNVATAALAAFPETWETGKLVYESFWMLITGQASCRDMSGVIGVVDAVSETVAQAETAADAAHSYLFLMALIAVNLGIVNLLPLPALDGGRLIFIIIEMIRKKPVPPEKEGMVHLIGMGALLLLILAVTVNDIIRCFGG